ncbi:hypothetical protein FPV67DRAFT_1426804 [Lyophyllum atratum]|nr:hypothetical protein FPV67DRAFT_1426804 [Lyophyllum atratum]
MSGRRISRDLKIAAMNLYEYSQVQSLITLEDICDCVGFSEQTFYRVLNLWRETGDIMKHFFGVRGRPHLLMFDDFNYLLRLIRHRPDWFMDELVDLLYENRFISVHFTTIIRELARAGYTVKKLKRIAAERNEEKRGAYIYGIAQYSWEQIGFTDETSKDEKTPGWRHGRAKKGRRAM